MKKTFDQIADDLVEIRTRTLFQKSKYKGYWKMCHVSKRRYRNYIICLIKYFDKLEHIYELNDESKKI